MAKQKLVTKELKQSKMEILVDEFVGKRVYVSTKDGDFEGEIKSTLWMGATMLVLENPLAMINTHTICYLKEIEDSS